MKTPLLVFALISTAVAQQPQPQSTETQKPAVLEGKVVNAKTGEPLRRVNVTLRPFGMPGGMAGGIVGPMMPAAPYAATTDAEGKFRIEKVEPGNYRMMAERQGFVRQEYGARQQSMMGSTIKLSAGQEMKELLFRMQPQAVITGRVLDEEGEPLAHVQLQVMRKRFFQGQQRLMPMGGGQTLDTGEFRISDLAPGRYWLSATHAGRMMMMEGPARNTGDKPEEEYVTTYYPSALEQDGARSLDLTAGQELAGIDIRLLKARVYRIRGKVAGGTAGQRVRIMLMPRDRNAFMGMFRFGPGSFAKEDGTFELGTVQPGSYSVAATSAQGMMRVLGKVPVDVGEGNVENVALVLGSGVTLKGAMRADGDVAQWEQAQGKKMTFSSARVQLMPVDGMPMNIPGNQADEDGSFVIENVGPERYRVTVFGLPQNTWLKSIRAGDQEVLDGSVDLSAGSPGSVQITLGLGTGQLSGTVQDAKNQPAPGAMVTLIPNPVKPERMDLFRMTTADQNGQFAMQGIPPGEYRLIAWEDVDPGVYMDPEFLSKHESSAKTIVMKANGTEQVMVAQVPAEATAQQP